MEDIFVLFAKKYKSIDINEIKKLDEINIIDVRSAEEYQQYNINGTRNIELMELLSFPEKYLKKDEIYYLMCASGMRSNNACASLSKLNYNVINLKGGIMKYNG